MTATADDGRSRLPSWRPGPTRDAVIRFIDAADDLPVDERVAVFDNDGTLWCEKPTYIQLDFMLAELARAVETDPSLARREEYRALLEHDRAAQAKLGLPRIALALVELCAGIEPVEFDARVRSFFASARHRDHDVPYLRMRYVPMLELLDELRAHGFSIFIVSGGGTEFVRAIGAEYYGVDPEDVVGSMVGYELVRDDAGRPTLLRTSDAYGEVDEGPEKVANIQRALGRQPILAAGNSPGDREMLEYAMASDGPHLALLIDHDDAEREYAYQSVAGSFDAGETAIDQAHRLGWTVVSMAGDWSTVFDH